MSVIESIKEALPVVESDQELTETTFECQECGTTFESRKTAGRTRCPDCYAQDVEKP